MSSAPAAPVTGEMPMTADQTALLRQLALDAYEPDAYRPALTQAEAARRIATLKAKIELMGEPPHTQ